MSSKPNPVHAEPLSKSRLRLWLRFLKTSRLIEDRLRRKFRDEFRTTLPRFDVMAALSRFEEGLKMSEISALLKMSNGNITGIVDRLTEEGYAVRASVQGDRRASRVILTPKGQAAFNEQAAAHEIWVDEILASVRAEEIEPTIDRLDRLAGVIERG